MEDTTMIIPAIVTLLFILTVSLVGGYYSYKEEKKWEDALMKHIEDMIDEKTGTNAKASDGHVVSADAKPMTEVV